MPTATRKASEDALLKDAVAAFKARAQLATDALGGKGYKIVNLNLNSNGYPQPYMRAPMMMKAASDGFCSGHAGSGGRHQPGQHDSRRFD